MERLKKQRLNKGRYIRQTLLSEIGEAGQEKLLAAHVAVVGCGGLGSIAAPYLAGAGVGKLTLIDGDSPHISNLHRQVFFSSDNGSQTKSEVMAQHIQSLNPEIEVTVRSQMLDKASIRECLHDVDVVLECTDNIQTKYLVNDYCALHRLPMVYGAIHKYDGYVSFFENTDSGSVHLRDVFPEPNEDIPTCSEVGVFGSLAGLIGLMQANEAIKFISRAGECLIGKLLTYNILRNEQMKISLKKTFMHDLDSIFSRSSYLTRNTCNPHEITLEQLIDQRDNYDLISILEDYEHRSIDQEVKRMPLSTLDIKNFRLGIEKPLVFYCMSGVRSGNLVNQIKSTLPDAEIYSLRGGLKAFKEKP